MDLDRIETIIRWMSVSPVCELEISEGDFRLRLVRGGGRCVTTADETADTPSSIVAAPGHGVVHLAPRPGAEPFVSVGTRVEPGQTLCMLEAMKAFTPVEAETGGTVTGIRVSDGADVEAGQPLFTLG